MADAAAADQIDDPQQHHGANKRPQQTDRAEGVETGTHTEKAAEEIAEKSPNDTDDDIQNDALLPIRAHDDAGQPADDAANNQSDDQAHGFSLPEPPDKRRYPAEI